MKTSSRRLLQVWIACCAILLNALAPAVSHALALNDANGRGWEICLNDGTRLSGSGELDQATFLALTDRSRSLSAKVPTPAPVKPMTMADCGYCLPNAGPLGMPPAMLQALPFAALPAERPFLFYHAPRPLQAWVAAHPRGPPADA